MVSRAWHLLRERYKSVENLAAVRLASKTSVVSGRC
jgi:hypothetical protein